MFEILVTWHILKHSQITVSPNSQMCESGFKAGMGNILSSPCRVEEGVPQGSVLSVTCFAVAINSIINEVSSAVCASLFVDDLAIYCTAYDAASACRYLQKYINCLQMG